MNIVAQLIRSFKPEVKIIKDFNVGIEFKGKSKNLSDIQYYIIKNNHYYNILVYNNKVLKFN